MDKKILEILKVIANFNETTIVAIIVLLIIFVALIRLVLFRKLSILELLAGLGLTIAVIFANPQQRFVKIFIIGVYLLILIWAFYRLITAALIKETINRQVNDYTKNALYDYYFYANRRDKVKDASSSFNNLIKLSKKQLRKISGVRLLFNELKITKINDEPIGEFTATAFYYEYLAVIKQHQDYQFTFEISESESYQAIIHPVYYKDKRLGYSCYISNNRYAIFDQLQTGLKEAINELSIAKSITDILLSLTPNVMLYYDFEEPGYILTTSFKQLIKEPIDQYSEEQYLELIHPQDRIGYLPSLSAVASNAITHLKYRLIIKDQVFEMIESTINYLPGDKRLSVIYLEPLLKEKNFPQGSNFPSGNLNNESFEGTISPQDMANQRKNAQKIFEQLIDDLKINPNEFDHE